MTDKYLKSNGIPESTRMGSINGNQRPDRFKVSKLLLWRNVPMSNSFSILSLTPTLSNGRSTPAKLHSEAMRGGLTC